MLFIEIWQIRIMLFIEWKKNKKIKSTGGHIEIMLFIEIEKNKIS